MGGWVSIGYPAPLRPILEPDVRDPFDERRGEIVSEGLQGLGGLRQHSLLGTQPAWQRIVLQGDRLLFRMHYPDQETEDGEHSRSLFGNGKDIRRQGCSAACPKEMGVEGRRHGVIPKTGEVLRVEAKMGCEPPGILWTVS